MSENPDFIKGHVLFNNHRFKEAIAHFKKAIGFVTVNNGAADSTELSTIYGLMALCYSITGDYDASKKHIENAMRIAPNRGKLHRILASIESKYGRKEAARAAFRESVRLEPNQADFWGGWGELELETGDKAAALSYINQGLLIDAQDESCLCAKVKLHIDGENFEEAEFILRGVLNTDPHCLWALTLQGMLDVYNNRISTGKDRFLSVLRINPHDHTARDGLASCLALENGLFKVMAKFSVYTEKLRSSVVPVLIGVLLLSGFLFFEDDEKTSKAAAVTIVPFHIFMFLIMTQQALKPIADVFIFFHREGRVMQRARERQSALFGGGAFLISTVSGIIFMAGGEIYFSYCFILFGFVAPLLSAVCLLEIDEESRYDNIAYAALLTLTGIVGIVLTFYGQRILNPFSLLFVGGYIYLRRRFAKLEGQAKN